MGVPVPPAFTLHTDVSPAAWIVERLKPWGKDRVRLWSFMPDAFEAYARILHPAYYEHGDARTARWSELAAAAGVALTPDIGFRAVSGIDPADQQAWYDVAPSDGRIEQGQLAALTAILAPFTESRDQCWLGIWEGWGGWWPGATTMLFASRPAGPEDAAIAATIRAENQARIRGAEILRSTPRIEIPQRAYFLFSCRLQDVPTFAIGRRYESPSLWWPDDRAWCVATEIDGYSTYVGGSKPCISALIASVEVEAIEVPADVPMDPGPY